MAAVLRSTGFGDMRMMATMTPRMMPSAMASTDMMTVLTTPLTIAGTVRNRPT